MSKQSRWVAANIGRLAKSQVTKLNKMGKVPVPESVQVQRFMDGGERWRAEGALVDPHEWKAYQEAMLEKVGAVQTQR